jgi:predicted SprT family Zn-dependent metalloprotease
MALPLPTTWKPCKDTKLNQIYNEVYTEAQKLGLLGKLHYKHPLYIHKSVRNFGLCRSRHVMNGVYDSAICINDKILLAKKYDVAREIIVHEIAHMAEPENNHGYLWNKAGNLLGKKWNITVNRTGSYEGLNLREKKKEGKYIVECPKCHAQWKYDRMCKSVEKYDKYRCGKCKEILIRIK